MIIDTVMVVELTGSYCRLIITDDSDINTPAVAAAYAVKRYNKQAQDEISFEVRRNGLLQCRFLDFIA